MEKEIQKTLTPKLKLWLEEESTSIKFEKPIDPEKVDANFRHGCLTVEVEKKDEEEDEGREIEVK